MQKEPLCWKSKDEVPEENRVIDIFSNIYDQPMSEYKAELKADHHGDVFATHMTYITHTGRGQSLQHSLVLGIEPRTSCILGEHLTTGLYPQPHSASYWDKPSLSSPWWPRTHHNTSQATNSFNWRQEAKRIEDHPQKERPASQTRSANKSKSKWSQVTFHLTTLIFLKVTICTVGHWKEVGILSCCLPKTHIKSKFLESDLLLCIHSLWRRFLPALLGICNQ